MILSRLAIVGAAPSLVEMYIALWWIGVVLFDELIPVALLFGDLSLLSPFICLMTQSRTALRHT